MMKRLVTTLTLSILWLALAACTATVDTTATPTAVPPTNTATPSPTQTAVHDNPPAAILPSPSPTPSATPTATATPTPQPTSEAIAGWLAYHNDFFNYTISYPPEARISVRGFSGFPTEELPAGLTVEEYAQQLEAIYPDDICVSLAYAGGFVTILPPAEAGGKYGRPCGVTGVGDYDIVDVAETVTIDGTTYTAEGWQVRLRDEAATWHNEFYFIWLGDGTLLQFGSTAGTEDQFLAVKDTLLQIIASYRSTD